MLAQLAPIPASITFRRTFGHSLLLLPLWAGGLAWLLRRRWPHRSRGELLGLCLLGAAGHVFFDLVNSFGVLLLWPLSPWRAELAIVFIIDIVLTSLLAAPHLARLKESWRPRLEAACRASCLLAALYVAFCAASRGRASALLARQGPAPRAEFSYVFPEPLGPRRWRGVLREGGVYRVYLLDPWGGQAELRREVTTAADDPRVLAVRALPLARRLEAFFKAPVWRIDDNGETAAVYDLRFRPLVIDRGRAFEYHWRVPKRP